MTERFKKAIRLVFFGACLAGSSATFGSDMKNCVTLMTESAPGTSNYRQVLVNGCGVKVQVFWCHTSGGSYPCKPPKYYRQSRQLGANERFHNQYSLPSSVEIRHGACTGPSSKIKFNADGSYSCPGDAVPLVKGPQRSQAQCKDGRKLDFEWSLKKEHSRGAILTLEDGKINLSTGDYQALAKNPTGPVPRELTQRVCTKPAERGDGDMLNDARERIRMGVQHKEKEESERCAKAGNAGDDCERFRNPKRSPSAGPVRG